MTPTVTIIGAGLGGLTLARVLQMNGVPVTVYELDSSDGARSQGGQLDLHPHNGQRALEIAGLMEQFHSIVNWGGAAARIMDRHGVVLADKPDDGSMQNPEALRGDIRKILLESLTPGTVQWGRKLDSATAAGDGVFRLAFADGTRVVTDLLVGADGVWSRVRPLVSGAQPTYSGMSYVDTYLDDVDSRHPAIAAAVGAGALYALEPGTGFLAHRETHGRIHNYLILTRPDEWFAEIDFTNAPATKTRLLEQFEGWAPELRSLVGDSDSAPILRSIYELPDSHRWEPVRGVTLLGDAAHASVPGGEGANNAMLDGAELGQAIATHPDDMETALAQYEQVMFERSAREAIAAHESIELIFGAGAPQRLADLFNGHNDCEEL